MTKIWGKAKRIKKLRDSGLFEEYPFLADSLVIKVDDGRYVLFERLYFTYWMFKIDSGFILMQNINIGKTLTIEELGDLTGEWNIKS
jgi:hypothetical protein